MEKISMVDLKRQYTHIKSEVDSAIQDVIDTTAFIRGGKVEEFEDNLAKYVGVKHVIGCGNGTDALQIACMALGLQEGDEIIVPSFTFIASAEIIALLKLTPVFVDVNYDTFNISIDAVKAAITPKTKAIIPVHLFGQCADMTELHALAKAKGIYLIEDACQALGSAYQLDGESKMATAMSDIACTSFFPSKNLGCYGDGGAIFTNNDELAKNIRAICNHGSWVKYHHDIVGVNSRLDTIQAAILNVKLPHLDAYCQARQLVAAKYNAAFAKIEGVEVPTETLASTHVYHQYTLKISNGKRDDLREYLGEKNVPSMVYYPIPLHLQKAYKAAKYITAGEDISKKLSECVLSLPIHTEMTAEETDYIIMMVEEFFKV